MSAEAAQLATEAVKETAQAGLLGTFGINWKLFVAQLANFAVVLFVMWKWVYTPLLKLIDARTAKIDKGLKDAEEAARARHESERESETTISAARREAQRLVETGVAEAERLRQEALRQTNAQVAKVVEDGRAAMNEERVRMVAEAKKELAELVVAAAGKVLSEELSDAQRKRMLESAAKKAMI